ncbi:MAG: hypothetical protein ACE5KG_02685 [Nitrososphaerales archaeon]
MEDRIEFDDDWSKVVTDQQTQTTRPLLWYQWYKEKVGFKVRVVPPNPSLPVHYIMLTDVIKTTLNEVASNDEYYIREGFSSGENFEKGWRLRHGSFDPRKEVCVMRFVKV